jgi:hypothetical protein
MVGVDLLLGFRVLFMRELWLKLPQFQHVLFNVPLGKKISKKNKKLKFLVYCHQNH